jgi:hypothetical protein
VTTLSLCDGDDRANTRVITRNLVKVEKMGQEIAIYTGTAANSLTVKESLLLSDQYVKIEND